MNNTLLRKTTVDNSYANQQLQQLREQHQYRQIPFLDHEGRYVTLHGQRLLNLSGNDYLGISYRQDWQQAFLQQCSTLLPFSSTSSRLLTGNFPIYEQLESAISTAFQRESCLLLNSGYHANIGILPALVDKNTLILADKFVHASLIDGIRLAAVDFIRYRHNDYAHLEALLAENSHYERIIIVTESVFSMDGDHADLSQLVTLKKHYPQVLLYVDEAHAIGVYGDNGLGLAEAQQCIADIDLLVGTFGKAMASIGAYVLCSQPLRQLLVNKMRPLIFSTTLPPFNIAWTYFVFQRLAQLKQQRTRLAQTSAFFRQQLSELFQVPMPSESCIVPYILGDNEKVIKLAQRLQQSGYYCLPIRPPTVPVGTARIRFSLNADVQLTELEQLLDVLKTI